MPPIDNRRIAQQLQFITEIDQLKSVLRQTLLCDRSRQENSAEHSWHIAMMAILLEEYAPQPVNLMHVMKLLLVHDLVEIDAGDTFCYDPDGNQTKADREVQAADRLFGLLPPDLGKDLRACWDEYEAQTTADAQFAKALDCLQPFLNNLETDGHTWTLHGISAVQVRDRMKAVKIGTPALWPFIEQGIQNAIAAGVLKAA